MRKTALLLALAVSLAGAQARPADAPTPVRLDATGLSPHATVLWVGAHPDDEALVAGAAAAACSSCR